MSQSNDSPAPCADKGGRGKSTTSVCDTLCSEARGQKKRNLATVTIVAPPTGKRKRNPWVWKVMQQFEPPASKCSVQCSVEVSKYITIQSYGALFAWSGSTGTSTLASHIKRAHSSVHSELMVAGASSRESREERKDAVMATQQVKVGVCVRCSLFSVSTYRFEQ